MLSKIVNMKLASYNLENLFSRPMAMNISDDALGRKAIEDHALANKIVSKEVYSQEDKDKLVELSGKYKWHILNPPKNALVQLNKIRGQLFRKPKNGDLYVVADGRDNWVGWFELLKKDVNWKATYNTGRVIAETNADILVTVEIENRPTMINFNDQVLKSKFNYNYEHLMVIDGNDMRGIDLGIMSHYPIRNIISHVDDLNTKGNPIFSRDCPEYDIELPSGDLLIVIPNHFKSKRSGNDTESQNRRKDQAKRAHEIAKEALKRSPYVVIAGDLNDTPGSDTMKDLFKAGFKDIQSHASYPKSRPGTFGTGLAGNKIDYLIMSPQLFSKIQSTGIERRGSYHPNIWESFDTVTNSIEDASDHHLIWAEVDF